MPRLVMLIALLCTWSAEAKEVRFSREILPLLGDRCFHCHGPDDSHRKAGLRLDREEEVRALIGNGELLHRLTTKDVDEQMPPPDSHREPLNGDELALIEQWMAQGAPWGKHWAFEKPTRPAVPKADGDHPVDAFVRARLMEAGKEPSPRAADSTLLRRLSFDLTGLPPTRAEQEKATGETWKESVKRLLASPHHGERLAMWWLDAARYADTDGYQADAERQNWPWRDWVVEAFNNNMPFDQFTIEQFAGDLLPDATKEQILATCFHRNHMTNGEGGRDPEESRIDYVIDRVNTMGTVWLGLTLGCTQCHTHKFDPISHEDYYSLFAFFNSIEEDGKAGSGAKPYLDYQSPHGAREVAEMKALLETCQEKEAHRRSVAEERFESWLTETRDQLEPDYKAWTSVSPSKLESAEGTVLVEAEDTSVVAQGPNPFQDDYRFSFRLPSELERLTGWRLEVLPIEESEDVRLSRGGGGDFILTNVKLLVRRLGESQVRELALDSAKANSEKGAKGRNYGNVKDVLNDDPRNGWTTGEESLKKVNAVFALAEPYVVKEDEELIVLLYHRSTNGDANIGRFRIGVSDQAGEAVRSLEPTPLEDLAQHEGEVDGELRKRLFAQYLVGDAAYQKARQRREQAKRQLDRAKKAQEKVPVMVLAERKEPRKSHVLERGVWDAKGKEVRPAMLPAVMQQTYGERSPSRLDLAHWLVSPENPLTARVVVNHLWQLVFGAGLVRTPEDFGLQGSQPTHPDLLDWLAVELIENEWDLRHMLELLVTSETYQQSSHTTEADLEEDPKNLLWSRAFRYRLPAWMIRDAALQTSGLLHNAIGGPPVKPYQPEGVWEEMFMGRFRYEPSIGKSQYRRTLYAYWRRTAAPTFLFDSAQRRVCEVSNRRTNTPLHALTLLNDQTMLESSRVLAKEEQSLPDLFQRVLSRAPKEPELKVLEREYARALGVYERDLSAAEAFLTVGQSEGQRDAAMAARMVVASLILNLDESMTHE